MLLALVASWIVLAQANPPPAPKADPLLAQQLLAAGRTRDAEAMYEQLVQLAPSDGSLWNALGGARFAQKDYLDAIPAFRRAHELLPSNLTVLDNLGCSYFNAQQLDAARETFQKSVEVAPSAPRSHTFLGRIAALRGDASTAESEFQLAVGSPQVDSLAPFHYGLHLFQERRLEDAARAFEYALRLDPEFASAHMNLGLVLQRRGDMARAEFHMARFRELTEPVLAEDRRRIRVGALLRDVQREFEAANLDAALGFALDAAREAPEAPVVHSTLARLYQLKGRHDDAQRELELARKLTSEPRKQ